MQRVAIARALMNNPSIVLADEPTGNLDAENSQIIVSLLTSIQEHTGCTLIVATHDLSIARRADRVIRVERGRLVDASV